MTSAGNNTKPWGDEIVRGKEVVPSNCNPSQHIATYKASAYLAHNLHSNWHQSHMRCHNADKISLFLRKTTLVNKETAKPSQNPAIFEWQRLSNLTSSKSFLPWQLLPPWNSVPPWAIWLCCEVFVWAVSYVVVPWEFLVVPWDIWLCHDTHGPPYPSVMSVSLTLYSGEIPLQNSSGVAILMSSQECGFFQHITVHRTTTSRKPHVKIRLAFHFVEHNHSTSFGNN